MKSHKTLMNQIN